MRIVGIDPAPTKKTTVCISDGDEAPRFADLKPVEVLPQVEAWCNDGVSTLFLWDAPLGLDRFSSRWFHSRAIDSATQRWLKGTRRVEPRAVGVSAAAQCPHNLLSQHVWGLPVGEHPRHGLRLVQASDLAVADDQSWLAEVHPAVAVAAWWSALGPRRAMPRYKPGGKTTAEDARANLQRTVRVLERILPNGPRPSEALVGEHGWDDDRLDAWVAWRLGCDLLAGRAQAVGPTDGGTYVLPKPAVFRDGTLEVPRMRGSSGHGYVSLGLMLWNELSERGPLRPAEQAHAEAVQFLTLRGMAWDEPYVEATFDEFLEQALVHFDLPQNYRSPW